MKEEVKIVFLALRNEEEESFRLIIAHQFWDIVRRLDEFWNFIQEQERLMKDCGVTQIYVTLVSKKVRQNPLEAEVGLRFSDGFGNTVQVVWKSCGEGKIGEGDWLQTDTFAKALSKALFKEVLAKALDQSCRAAKEYGRARSLKHTLLKMQYDI